MTTWNLWILACLKMYGRMSWMWVMTAGIYPEIWTWVLQKTKLKKKRKCIQLKSIQSTDPYCNRILTISLLVDEEILYVKFKTFGADSIICPTTELLSQILLFQKQSPWMTATDRNFHIWQSLVTTAHNNSVISEVGARQNLSNSSSHYNPIKIKILK